MEQAQDFLEESRAIHALIKPLDDQQLDQETGFKGWTINSIIRHLHIWNKAAHLSLVDEPAFDTYLKEAMGAIAGGSMRDFESDYLNGLSGQPLIEEWRAYFEAMAPDFAATDPAKRLKWAGPSMSARSSITARLMENWAHAQAIYDALGLKRENADRIRNVVMIGLNTYGWTFKVNKLEAPEPIPYLKLTAPSGTLWEYGEPNETEKIEGKAEEFCQVVTQCRNIADTSLSVTGPNATHWMAIAQCFAGGAETPPPPGSRKKAA